MKLTSAEIVPCLWFDGTAEAAAELYVSTFPNSRIGAVTHYQKAGQENHGQTEGSVMTVEFYLDGMRFVGLNGGPMFKFTEAVSFQVQCDSQDEIDHYWTRLGEGGEPGPCGWLKDRFGLSWQVTPRILIELLTAGDAAKAARVTTAFMKMGKFDIAALERAAAG